MSQEAFYRSTDGRTVLYGRVWTQVPRMGREVLRCSFGRHKRVQWGTVSAEPEERCSCGAIRNKPTGPWRGGDARTTRIPPDRENFTGPFSS